MYENRLLICYFLERFYTKLKNEPSRTKINTKKYPNILNKMIRFYYSPDGLYKEHDKFITAEANESFVVDEAHNKIRLFDTKDFYFQTLSDIVDENNQNPSVGLS